jgi:hypothetical protein
LIANIDCIKFTRIKSSAASRHTIRARRKAKKCWSLPPRVALLERPNAIESWSPVSLVSQSHFALNRQSSLTLKQMEKHRPPNLQIYQLRRFSNDVTAGETCHSIPVKICEASTSHNVKLPLPFSAKIDCDLRDRYSGLKSSDRIE